MADDINLNAGRDLSVGGDFVGRDKTTQTVTITGDVSGQVAVGHNIQQAQTIGQGKPQVTEEEIQALRQMLVELVSRIEAEAPVEKRGAAKERADELSEALLAPRPDLSTLEYVKNWFAKNVPALAGAVANLILHPIAVRLVEAGGEITAAAFKRRFEG